MTLEALTYMMTAIFGLVVGSFLNVLIARLPQGKSIVRPGSQCPHCKSPIRWWQNIPVFSFLYLLGKCAHCQHPISIRYPVIEILTAVLFVAARSKFDWNWILWFRDWPFLSLLVAITFIDLEHRIIPDTLSIPGLVLGLATSWAVPDLGWMSSVLGALLGFSVFYGLAWIYQKTAKRSGLGGGDIKLLAMIGAFVGPFGVFLTILISSVFGSVFGIVWALASKQKNLMTTAIPYGPFLVVGGLCAYFLGDYLWLRYMIPM